MPTVREKGLHEKILESPALLGLLIFFIMAILNFSCWENPPYWDDILGLHNQAIWLANNNFNIVKLWETGDYYVGGSNIYRFGMIPYFYAFLYSVFSPKITHVIGHLFNMGCLALTFGVGYSLLRKFKLNNYIALLWCTAIIYEPIMSGRVVALGQECPLTCATLVSIYFLFKKKYGLGIFFIFIAMLCKMTAGVLLIAFALWLLLDIYLAKGKRKEAFKKNYLYLIAVIILVSFFFFDIFGRESERYRFDDQIFVRFFFVLKYHFSNLLIIQFVALCMMALLAIYQIVLVIKNKKIFVLSEKENFSLFLLILCGGFWMSYGLCALPLPRYSAFIVFPMYIFIAVNMQFKRKFFNISPALVLLLLGLANINGAFYPKLKTWEMRSGETLERSREYLTDLWENQASCKLLETKYFDRPIVAKWPFLQMLTVPEMGYVTKALPNVYAACPPVKYAKVKPYRTGMEMPDNTLYIFSFNTFECWKQFGPSLSLKRGEKYKVIHENNINGGWFVIYEKEPQKK